VIISHVYARRFYDRDNSLGPLQVSAWHDLLQGVMEDIMQRLSCDEIWTCRSLSGRWAAAARATGRMIVTTAVPPLEWAKLPEHLSQLQKLHISHLGLKYWIDVVPPDPGAFASLLTVLSTQVTLLDCTDNFVTLSL